MKIYFIRNTHDENGNYRGEEYFGMIDFMKFHNTKPIPPEEDWEKARQHNKTYQEQELPMGVHTWHGSGEKTFQAQLIDIQDFDKFWENGIASSAVDTDLVVVSTPKKINGEYRIVCSKYNGGEIIAGSTYQYQGKSTLIPSVPPEATKKCREILDVGWFPDSIFCVDIAEDADGNCWLLELTSFSSAGLYLTDKVKVVNRVNEIVEMEYESLRCS